MKKSTAMNDTIADRDAEIAMIMSMGSATAEEASRALEENDGDVDCAMAQLYGTTPEEPRRVTRASRTKSSRLRQYEDNDDYDTSKPPTMPPPEYAAAIRGSGMY